MTTVMLKKNPVKIKEYNRMKSTILGKISFGLALSPWFFTVLQMLSIPGFG